MSPSASQVRRSSGAAFLSLVGEKYFRGGIEYVAACRAMGKSVGKKFQEQVQPPTITYIG